MLVESARSNVGLPPQSGSMQSRQTVGLYLWFVGCLFLAMPAIRPVPQLNLSDTAFLLSAGAMLISGFDRRYGCQPAYGLAASLAVGAAILASYNANDLAQNWTVAFRLTYLWLVWRAQARRFLIDTYTIERSVTLFVIGAAISGAFGIAQAAFGSGVSVGGGLQGWQQLRAAGLSGHVNDQGGALGLAVVVSVSVWLSSKNRRRRLVLVGCMPVVVAGLIFSGSVSGMFCAAFGVLMLVVFQRPGARFRGLLFAAFAAVVFWVLALVQQSISGVSPFTRLLSVSGENGDISTVATRLQTDGLGLQAIARSPLVGAGLDSTSGAILNQSTSVHNIFILYWFQGGCLLLVALLIVLVTCVAGIRKSPTSSLKTGTVICAASMLLYAQTAPVTFERFFWLPFILLCSAHFSPVLERSDGIGQPMALPSSCESTSTKGQS